MKRLLKDTLIILSKMPLQPKDTACTCKKKKKISVKRANELAQIIHDAVIEK